MAWTTPRTWVDTEVITASIMNTHLKDNQNVIKTSIGNDGKFLGLSASTLADLSGTNLTGLAKLASGNTFTGGRHSFNEGSASRVILPVGVDKFDGVAHGDHTDGSHTDAGKTPGSIWVEGNYLHHVASNANEWRFLGDDFAAAAAGAKDGSWWIEGNNVHYIDNSHADHTDGAHSDTASRERRVLGTSSGFHSDAAAKAGSPWVETYLHWIKEGGTQEYQGHQDTHADQGHTDLHGDGAHTDTHDDSHDDNHNDGHGDGHDDGAHTDVGHSDIGHGDGHGDHFDVGHGDSHGDTAHSDSAHQDVAHNDTHNDSHSDSHSDSHTDTHDDSHDDSHGDLGHQDTHSDAPESVGL